VADIFVSYTTSDRDWAFWIGHELEKLGHRARIDAWEVSDSDDVVAWTEERHKKADHILCVISETYLRYASLERRAVQWVARNDRPNFLLSVRIDDRKLPNLLASTKHCDLFGIEEDVARTRLTELLRPVRTPLSPTPFPGAVEQEQEFRPRSAAFPGRSTEPLLDRVSNIPTVPAHFYGRKDELAAIEGVLKNNAGGEGVVALFGLGGVGKSTLAAVYANRHRNDYRATWWIRAESELTIWSDLVDLGARLGWIAADDKTAHALSIVIERLRIDGEGILLIYDDAMNSDVWQFLPRRSEAQAIVTCRVTGSGGIPQIAIDVWPREVGADYLITQTGLHDQLDTALTLSQELGGLPLTHEIAVRYINRHNISLADYLTLLERERKDLSEKALLPPRDPLPDASPATHFAFVEGKLDLVPSTAWRKREGQAAVYHARARALVQNLQSRLEMTDAVPDLATSVSALVDVLGEDISGVQPDQLRLAARSISAKARTYGHSVSAFFELNDVLVDLQSFALTEIEAHEAAIRNLDLSPSIAAEAKSIMDLFTQGILASSEIVNERVELAFENAARLSDSASDEQVKVQIEGIERFLRVMWRLL
jgi:hypothetical protein